MPENLIINGWPASLPAEEIERLLLTVGPISEFQVLSDEISSNSWCQSVMVKYETEELNIQAVRGFQNLKMGDVCLTVEQSGEEIENLALNRENNGYSPNQKNDAEWKDFEKLSARDNEDVKNLSRKDNNVSKDMVVDADKDRVRLKEKESSNHRSRSNSKSISRHKSRRDRESDSRERRFGRDREERSSRKSSRRSRSRSRSRRGGKRKESSRERRRHNSSRSVSPPSRHKSRKKSSSSQDKNFKGLVIPAALSSLPHTVALGLVAQGITSLPDAITNPPPSISVPGLNPFGTGGSGVVGNLSNPMVKAQLEIFVGNVPPGCSPHALMEFLNAAMHQVHLVQGHGDPILSARISQKFAFATFRTVSEASAALNMTGIPFMGTFLKIQRPSNYRGPPDYPSSWQVLIGQAPPSSIPPPATLALLDPNTKISREIFVGNVPLDADGNAIVQFLNSAMIQVGLARSPGNPIVNIRMNNRFSFLEFRTIEEASSALFMNNIPFANTNLIFSRPSKYAGPVTPSRTWFELLAENALMNQTPGDSNISYSTPQPSCVVRIGGVVNAEELSTEDGYQEIVEDMREECGKYGIILSIEIPKMGETGMGYIYVQYGTIDEATKAKYAFSSRTFDGQQVEAIYYPEDNFHQRMF